MNNAIEKYSTVLWISLFVLAMAARLSVAIATPDWQAVDEYPHYYVAEYLAEHGSFPQSKPEHPHYEAINPRFFIWAWPHGSN